MALGGAQFGSAIGGFFGKDKLKPQYFNKPLAGLYGGEYIDALRGLRGASDTASADYAANIAAATPQARALGEEDLQNLTQMIRGSLSYDPVSTYERIRGGNLAAFSDQARNLGEYGSAADKMALAARGYGGRGPGAYESILRQDRISKNIAPVLNTIFSTLGPDASASENNRWNNIMQFLNLSGARSAIPDRLASRALLPAQAQQDLLARELGTAGILGEASQANTAGFRLDKNKWRNFFEQMGAGTDALGDTAMNLAAMYFGGGMGGGLGAMGGMAGGGAGGGGMGGLGGMGGGGRTPPPTTPAYYNWV